MSKAVRFDQYGELDVLEVREVKRPEPGPGEVVVRVKAAGINPGEASIRKGLMRDIFPTTFPSGQGSDFAGVVSETGSGADSFTPGDEVVGFTEKRGSHAEFVVVPERNLVPKPEAVSWDVAGALYVAGTSAYAAVRHVNLAKGDVVVVAGAAGGVGSIAVQLAAAAGATVVGIAGPSNDEWLRAHDVIPVNYGDGLSERLRAAAPAGRIDAFLDFFGGGYVELAVDELGVAPERVNTIIDFVAAERFGVGTSGNADAANADVLADLVALVADGRLDVPIAQAYDLDDVRKAFSTLEQRHTRGKLVLRP
jgi:NADPH:quinone reductase-like Zn-dependent oxidoreductase